MQLIFAFLAAVEAYISEFGWVWVFFCCDIKHSYVYAQMRSPTLVRPVLISHLQFSSPISLLKKTPPFPASPFTATPSVTQNPSREDKEKKALFQNLMWTFPKGKNPQE